MRPEALFSNWFKAHAPTHWHVQSIETSTSNGVPDLNIRTGSHEFWLELKVHTKYPELRPEQFAWSQRRIACGGHVFCLHRRLEMPWFLHDLSRATFRAHKSHVQITSSSDATGYTMETFNTAIHYLLCPPTNS